MDFLEDIWDNICDTWGYFWSFEWFGDLAEIFSGMFENLGELSFIGLAFGTLAVVLVYFLHGYMVEPFVKNMIGLTKYIFQNGSFILMTMLKNLKLQ